MRRLDLEHVVAEGDDIRDRLHLELLGHLQESILFPQRVLPREKVLHCAQSLYHDIGPASALGFQSVWVNRRAGKAGGGATPPADATPDLEVPDLASLASAAGL